ncbi:MAG: hypothetical protein KGJ43_06605, partial [Acidobacteriota bacterium]|nr:hypothetical protein [Acidobacteriota bacterium]
VALPFVLASPAPAGRRLAARSRLALLATAVGALALALVLSGAIFGSHALGFLGAVSSEQRIISVHSVPAETARMFGLVGLPGWWRDLFLALFAGILAVALAVTSRCADWRTAAGFTTLALVLCTAWLLPWYAVWPLPFAALSASRALRGATLVLCAYALAIHLPLAAPLLNPPPPRAAARAPLPTHGPPAARAAARP